MEYDFTLEISRGIKWLDEHFPNWRSSVDASTLNMSDPYRCILGQVYGDFDLAHLKLEMTLSQASGMGFYYESGHYQRNDIGYAALTEQWKTRL